MLVAALVTRCHHSQFMYKTVRCPHYILCL